MSATLLNEYGMVWYGMVYHYYIIVLHVRKHRHKSATYSRNTSWVRQAAPPAPRRPHRQAPAPTPRGDLWPQASHELTHRIIHDRSV